MDVKSKLISLLSNFQNIIFHEALFDDIDTFCENSNEATIKEFFKSLYSKLHYLNEVGFKATLTSGDSFKRMKKSKGLSRFSLSVKNYNLRIIYTDINNGQLLLLLFDEKAGKKATNYESAIPIAEKRKEQYEQHKENCYEYYKKCQ